MKEGTKELFEKLYNENNFDELNKHVIKRTKNVLIAFGIFLLSAVVWPHSILIGMPILFIYVASISSKNAMKMENERKKKVEQIYKEKIVAPILKYNYKDIQYFPNEGIALEEYKKAEYIDRNINKVNEYSSNDHMILPLIINGQEKGNIDINDVRVVRTYKDNDGHKREEIIHQGLTANIKLPKSINNKLKLKFNVIFFGVETAENKDINLDMAEFEKYFDVYCSDDILAMRIFTAEVMEKLLDIFKTSHRYFDINILNDKLYIRIHNHSFFEPVIILNKTEYQQFEADLLVIEEVEILTKLIYDIIENIEV